MTINISHREWEALSAFLDNQLNEKDRVRLEARLKQDPELQEALEGLRRTRMVLRSQPRMRAPRNFTLTPAMIGQKSQARPLPRAYPIFRMASALATLLFIFFFVGDLFTAAPAVPQQDFALTSEEMNRRAMAPPGYGGGEMSAESEGGFGGLVQAVPQAPSGQEDDAALRSFSAPAEGHDLEDSTEKFGPESDAYASPYGVGGGLESPEATPSLVPETVRRALQVGLLALAVLAGLAAAAVRRMTG